MDAPLLHPLSDLYDDDRKPVKLLDENGAIVQLPYDLTVPFARMVARRGFDRLKRFTTSGESFRLNPAGGQPSAVNAVAFDIVSTQRTAAAEGECISVLEEILSEFPGMGDGWEFQVNHALGECQSFDLKRLHLQRLTTPIRS